MKNFTGVEWGLLRLVVLDFFLLISGHGLILPFLQIYAASRLLAPNESKIPEKLVLLLTQNFVLKDALLEMPHKQMH
jgi:hypothetical protein